MSIEKHLAVGDSFPQLQGRMVSGSLFTPSLLQGKRIFYSFFRYTGCPACFVYFNQLQLKRHELEQRNIAGVLIYEVELSILQEVFLKVGAEAPSGESSVTYWGHFIADPHAKLYEACGVERSQLGRIKSILSPSYIAAGQLAKRKPLESYHDVDFNRLDLTRYGIDASGRHDRMPAQFLVDSKGKVELAYYGKTATDRLPLNKLL